VPTLLALIFILFYIAFHDVIDALLVFSKVVARCLGGAQLQHLGAGGLAHCAGGSAARPSSFRGFHLLPANQFTTVQSVMRPSWSPGLPPRHRHSGPPGLLLRLFLKQMSPSTREWVPWR
jgi:hypothetical protein